MSGDQNRPDELAGSLIDLQLGQLDPVEAARLSRRIQESPELRRQSEACGEWLDELNAYTALPPVDLAEQILSRIGRPDRTIPFPEVEPALLLREGGANEVRSPLFSLRELVVIAACIALFVGIFIPGYYKAQAISRKNLCRQHLAQIYRGLASYQQANAGFLPFAGAVPGGSWLQVRTPGVLRASNTRHLYLTVRDGYVTDTRVFICPGQENGVPMRMDNYRRVDDFAEPANIGYSVQNNNVPRQIEMRRLPSRMVYVADANPFFSGRIAHVLDPLSVENSFAHEQNAGQNILTLDGHVGWVSRPTVGFAGDHIYQAGTLKRYVGTELPQSPTDTFLVP